MIQAPPVSYLLPNSPCRQSLLINDTWLCVSVCPCLSANVVNLFTEIHKVSDMKTINNFILEHFSRASEILRWRAACVAEEKLLIGSARSVWLAVCLCLIQPPHRLSDRRERLGEFDGNAYAWFGLFKDFTKTQYCFQEFLVQIKINYVGVFPTRRMGSQSAIFWKKVCFVNWTSKGTESSVCTEWNHISHILTSLHFS